MNKNTIEYSLYGKAIEGLSAKQLALALSTQKLTPLQIEQIVKENDLIKMYGAEVLVKEGLISANSTLLASEKAVYVQDLQKSILKRTSNKEEAKEFIQKQLIIAANDEESASTVLLNKALMDEAVKRGILSEEKAAEILSTYGIVTADTAEIASKKSLTTAIITQTKAKIAATAAAHPLAAGITAIVAATYAAIKASEAWSNRLKKQAQESSNAYKDTLEEIESINSELQSNGQRIDELNAKENLTLVEAEELEKLQKSNRELENTLALKEKIAQQEKAEANKDAVKYFKEDTNTYNNKTGKFSSTHIEVATQYLDEIYKKEQRIHELELEMSRTDANTEKYRELSGELDMTQKSYEDLLQRVQDYNDVFTDLDDNLFEGKDDEYIQQLEAFYKRMNEVLHGVAETNTNAIRDILAKVDFQSVSKQLEGLGKSGELSVATLSSRFPELIDYLDKAGISAQELYQYIMALSNPDAINYAEVERQFRQSLGIRDGEINGASDQKIWDEIKDSFSDDEWQIALEVYLKVRDQYGDHPEGWNAKDWLSHIRSELETEAIEIRTQLSISETIDQLNTQLKPAFDSLQSAYKDIFDDDGKFQLNSIDILSTCDTIKSKLDSLNEMEGISVDYSSFEDFVKVLRDSESTEQDVEDAFDSLATSITQAALSGTEDFETMKAALEDLGVVNNEIVAFDALINNTEALKEAGLDLVAVSQMEESEADAVISAFAEEAVSAENLEQAINLLKIQKILCNENWIDSLKDINDLYALAQAAGIATDKISQLAGLKSGYNDAVARGDSLAASAIYEQIQNIKSDIEKEFADLGGVKVNWRSIGGGSGAAKSAGKSAGDAYKDGLKEALSDIEGVISGVTKAIDRQISSINAEKSAALDSIDAQKEALEEAKDAAIEALEAERDAQLAIIEDQKKTLEDQIKAKQDEIDAIEDAASARQRELDLQRAQYELEKMQNMRTKLVKK